jgi:hypothetical protein
MRSRLTRLMRTRLTAVAISGTTLFALALPALAEAGRLQR